MVARKYLPYYFSFVSLMWEWHPCHEFSRHHPIYREKHHTGMVDVYVIAHGWNFTLEESIGLYENYRLSAENFVESFKSTNPNDESFEPYFIFVSWTSVTRPLTDGFRSISPFGIPSPLKEILGFTDVVTFHIFSNWGETVSAYEIALGNSERMKYDPKCYTLGGEYDKEIKKIRNKIKNSKFKGYDIPASAIIDKLIQLREPGTKQGLKTFHLHTIGHSFGAKLISLASLDACAQVHWKENKEKKEHKTYIDSMILFNPAMNIAEMYEPVETPQKEREYLIEKVLDAPRDVIRYFSSVSPEEGDSNRFELVATTIKRKAIVFNRHDSATG